MNTIKAIAHLNELTREVNNDYYLQHQPTGTLYTADLIRRLEQKQIATNNVNGEAFVKKFFEECTLAVSEGYNVVTELFHISIGIKGVILAQNLGHNIPADQVNVRMNFNQSVEARKSIQGMTVHVAEQPAPVGPVIQTVCNPVRNEPDILNTGEMVLIQGLRIAVRGERVEEIGVWFNEPESGLTVHIYAESISPNTPSKLQFVLPSGVPPGMWKVSVATQAKGNSSTTSDNVRTYEYPNFVEVI